MTIVRVKWWIKGKKLKLWILCLLHFQQDLHLSSLLADEQCSLLNNCVQLNRIRLQAKEKLMVIYLLSKMSHRISSHKCTHTITLLGDPSSKKVSDCKRSASLTILPFLRMNDLILIIRKRWEFQKFCFVESEGSFCSQKPANGSYPESVHFFKWHFSKTYFNIVLPHTPSFPNSLFLRDVSIKILLFPQPTSQEPPFQSAWFNHMFFYPFLAVGISDGIRLLIHYTLI